MKTRLRITLAAIALVVTALAWNAWASPEAPVEKAGKAVNPTHFAFSLVTQSDGSFQARCESGCHWKKLDYTCNGKVPCCARVDERGVHGAPCPPAGE